METATRYVGGYAYQKLRRLGLSEEFAQIHSKAAKVASFKAEQVIWEKGTNVKYWGCVITGLVSACLTTEASETTPIALYGEESWFGEFSVINRKPAYASFLSMVPTDILTLPSDLVLELLEVDQGFALKVAKMMSWRAQKTSEMLMMMKLGNPCLRVVMGICQFAESVAFKSERPPTIGYGEGVVIPLTQDRLASLCGVSRTKFSEFVHQLALSGWVRVSYGKIETLCPETWHRFAALQRERSFSRLNPTIEELLTELRDCYKF